MRILGGSYRRMSADQRSEICWSDSVQKIKDDGKKLFLNEGTIAWEWFYRFYRQSEADEETGATKKYEEG